MIQQNSLGVCVIFTKRVWDSPGMILVGIHSWSDFSLGDPPNWNSVGLPQCVCECNSSWTIPGNQSNYGFDI